MKNVNGYFQLINKNNVTFIKLIPSQGDGYEIDINDVMDYLRLHDIMDYNFEELKRKLQNQKKEEMILLSRGVVFAVDEDMKVRISDDKMTASVRFYPPSNDGKRLSIEKIKVKLKASGVVYGVDETILSGHIKKPVYCTNLIIAQGKQVFQGKDAYIEYMFNTDKGMRPKHNEDGSVDFHQLNNISHVNKGDTLAVLHPAVEGKAGIDVTGGQIRPKKAAQKILSFGKDIGITEDKLRIYSLVNGHVSLQGKRVVVSNVYDVPGDVDTSTGDIDYEGNVVVHGTVRTGFRIRAAGDVEVFGSVEGAEIIAGGQVILHRGIQGMTKGKIVAKGNIVTKFIESSKVYSDGFIEVETIIQSQVSAGGDICVNGRRGQIIGGHIRSSKMIEAKVIGSEMGIATIIEVGYNPVTQDEVNTIKKSMTEKNEEYKRLIQIAEVLYKKNESGVLTDDQKETYKNCISRLKELKKDLLTLHGKLDKDMENMQGKTAEACVKVQKVIYPGTQLIISGEYYNILDETGVCKFYKLNGKITSTPL